MQALLADFRDSLQNELDPEVPLPQAFTWVSTQLKSKGSRVCSEMEFETVLTALERQNAIMLIEDEGLPKTLVFTT